MYAQLLHDYLMKIQVTCKLYIFLYQDAVIKNTNRKK